MKLINQQLELLFAEYPYRSQENEKNPLVLAKFFGGSSCTWLVTEATKLEDGDYEFFGLANLGYGYEWGSFLLSELMAIKFPPFGTRIERDLYCKGKRVYDLIDEGEMM